MFFCEVQQVNKNYIFEVMYNNIVEKTIDSVLLKERSTIFIKMLSKNIAYGRHQLSRRVPIVAPILRNSVFLIHIFTFVHFLANKFHFFGPFFLTCQALFVLKNVSCVMSPTRVPPTVIYNILVIVMKQLTLNYAVYFITFMFSSQLNS